MEDAWRRNGEAIKAVRAVEAVRAVKAVKAVRWEKIGGSLEDDGRRIGGGLEV